MATRGYLFKDTRDEEGRYCLFMDGLDVEDDDDPQTLEVRFHTMWDAVDLLGSIRQELGSFELELGEPEHYDGISRL